MRKYKWQLYWGGFLFLVAFLIAVTIFFEEKPWIGNVIQTIGILVGLYASVLIFTQSKEESDRQSQEHLQYMQNLTSQEIEALKNGIEKQINTYCDQTNRQISTLHELTEKQIVAIQKATEKQIDTIQKTTFDQINSFEKQTAEIATKLADNSILLAEILGRELEKAISQTTGMLEQAEKDYTKIQGFQIGRTQQEKENQLQQQRSRIGLIKQWVDYWNSKYNKLKDLFGFNDRLLNG